MQSTFFAWARLDFRHSARATSARLGLRKPSCASTSTSALALAGKSRTRLLRLSGAVRCALLSITDTPVGIQLAAVALTVQCSAYNVTTRGFGCWPAPRACSRWHRCGGLHVQCCFACCAGSKVKKLWRLAKVTAAKSVVQPTELAILHCMEYRRIPLWIVCALHSARHSVGKWCNVASYIAQCSSWRTLCHS